MSVIITYILYIVCLPFFRTPLNALGYSMVGMIFTRTISDSGILARLSLLEIGFLWFMLILFLKLLKIKKVNIKYNLFFLLVTIYLVAIMSSILNMYQVNSNSFMNVLIFIFLFVFMITVYNIIDNDYKFNKLLSFINIINVLILGIALYQFVAVLFNLPLIYDETHRIKSTFKNPNQLASILVFSLPISLYFQFKKNSIIKMSIILIIGLTIMISTGSRSSLLGLLIALILIVFISLFVYKKIRLVIIMMLFPLTLSMLYIASKLKTTGFISNLLGRYENVEIESGGFVSNNWGTSIEAFKKYPFNGLGIGNFIEYSGGYEVHSTYFSVLAETGLLGFIPFIIILVYTFLVALNNIRYNKYKLLSIYLFSVYTGFLVFSLYHISNRNRYFWLLIVLIFIVRKLQKDKM